MWALFGFFAGVICWTYARLSAYHFFHVSTSGPSGGAGRALVFLNFPTALVAIAIVLVALDNLAGPIANALGAVAIVLCAAVAWPGIVDQLDLDARFVNAIPAAGVLLAFGLTIAAARRAAPSFVRSAPGDRARLVLGILVVVFALMWITGEFGIFINRIPVVGHVFWARQPWAPFGQANLRPAVHLGHHHGFDGALLSLSALVLSRPIGSLASRRVRFALALYLAVMLAYGLANQVQDDWVEQLVKRGWIGWSIPSLLVPAATPEFVAMIAAGVVVYVLLFRRLALAGRGEAVRMPVVVLVPAAAAVVFALLGATADGRTVRVAEPSAAERPVLAAEGPIAFPMLDHGYKVFVMRGDGSDLHVANGSRDVAPSWSPDGRTIAYQSDRHGNTDVYVGNHRMTRDPADDGEPSWSLRRSAIAFVSTRAGNRELYIGAPSGRVPPERLTSNPARDEWPSYAGVNPVVFQSNRDGDFDLWLVNEDRSDLHRVTQLHGDELTPAWSPDLTRIAFAYRSDLYVLRADDRGRPLGIRRLTSGPGSDFAPAWSFDGRFIVFGSDREGRDQIFVVRSDGTGLRRLTSRQADKDAPDWG